MVIKIKSYTKKFCLLMLITLLGILQPVQAGLYKQPVISYSVMDCNKSYLVQLYKDGRVEYHGGVGVKTIGRHVSHISPQAIQALLTKIDGAILSLADERENLPALTDNRRLDIYGMSAIRINQANQDRTFYGSGKLGMGIFDQMFCLKELAYFGANKICISAPKSPENIFPDDVLRKFLKSTFSKLELEIISTTNLIYWVKNPGRSICFNNYSVKASDLKNAK